MYERPEVSKKAWQLREDGEPKAAVEIWSTLEKEAEKSKNWEEAIVCLTDIAIAYRIIGKEEQSPSSFKSALLKLKRAKFLSEKYNIPLLPDFDYQMGETFSALGQYKEAITSLETYLQVEGLTPEIEANTYAKIGYCLGKSGPPGGEASKKAKGIKILEDAIWALEHTTGKFVFENKDVVAIWKTGAKLNLAEVLEDKDRAKQLVQEVLQETQEKNLGARAQEAKRLLEKLSCA